MAIVPKGIINLKDTPINKLSVPFWQPTLLKGFCKDMPAIKKWKNIDYLKARFNNTKVFVETYKSKRDFEISKAGMKQYKFNDYLDTMGKDSKYAGTYVPDCSLLELEDEISGDIFEDLINPNDMKVGLQDMDGQMGLADDYNLYIGRDTKTGTHIHIEDDFLLNCIIGKKIVYFLEFKDLNIKGMFNKYSNFSKENFFRLDWNKYHIYRVELEPGDSVAIPPWWWHAVESDGYSLGVTKVFERDDQSEIYKTNPAFKPLYRRQMLALLNPFNWF